MARVLVVYHCDLRGGLLEANDSHIYSLERYSYHECYFFNADRIVVPDYLAEIDFDLVVFHYTFLVFRRMPEWQEMVRRFDFLRGSRAVKAMLPSDESWCGDQLVEFIEHLGVTHVFSFAPVEARALIYAGVDSEKVTFHSVLSNYIEQRVVSKVRRREKRAPARMIDIGWRSCVGSNMGSHGEFRQRMRDAFMEQAPAHGLTVDISSEYVFGDSWPDFLLSCRYQLGIESGASWLDRDGSILRYFETVPGASVKSLEAERPGVDGSLDYRALAPRHFDAIVAKCCQVLLEGDYSGVLQPNVHYIELKRDLSNVDEILQQVKDERHRVQMVERAYADIVLSGRYSYQVFVDMIFGETLGMPARTGRWGLRDPRFWMNRAHERIASFNGEANTNIDPRKVMTAIGRRGYSVIRATLVWILGERRFRSLVSWVRGESAPCQDGIAG